jgi:hypothetical protein
VALVWGGCHRAIIFTSDLRSALLGGASGEGGASTWFEDIRGLR